VKTKTSPRAARVARLEGRLQKQKAALAALRRQLPARPVADYPLKTSAGRDTTLAALFDGKKELILIHNMGVCCACCTMWADGFNGVQQHLRDRVAFVVESGDPPKVQAKFAARRGWNFPLVSSHGGNFRSDLGFGTEGWNSHPGVSVFVKKGRKIHLVSQAGFGPGDNYCIVWDLFDLLPRGSAGWKPRFAY
jgi:predicted dithiol-disulfide oxidoreductase (DUF899 family)